MLVHNATVGMDVLLFSFPEGQAMTRVYNFSPGPATLPETVLQQVKAELLDWQGLGMSVMEISHHSAEFKQLVQTAEQDLRELLNIPSQYKVLFLQGGGRSQFAMVPLNLLGGKNTADYIDTGIWSNMALKEASRFGEVNIVASSAGDNYRTIPPQATWQSNPDAAYFHYVDNETVNGVEFPATPRINYAPLVADMSSNILSRVIDVNDFGLIYAAAQKNMGPAGITLVIVREDLLGDALPSTPSMFNYTLHANANSLYNTPPTFAWYVTALMFQWLKKQGGVASIAATNARKAKKLYDLIDSSDFYQNTVDPQYRSRMNVVFKLANESLNESFLQAAKAVGIAGLKGHSQVGGMRASIYNAMPEAGVDALVEFMRDFEKRST
jgi:phosphoserine aminotransferase